MLWPLVLAGFLFQMKPRVENTNRRPLPQTQKNAPWLFRMGAGGGGQNHRRAGLEMWYLLLANILWQAWGLFGCLEVSVYLTSRDLSTKRIRPFRGPHQGAKVFCNMTGATLVELVREPARIPEYPRPGPIAAITTIQCFFTP